MKVDVKPACFTEIQWKMYQAEVQPVKNGKVFDYCFDCTVKYQSKMRSEGRCAFPMKRLDKIAEYV